MAGLGGANQTDDPSAKGSHGTRATGSHGTRPRPRRTALLAVAGVVAIGAALAAGLLVGNSSQPSGTSRDTWPSVGLASSFVTSAGSWAILPMGHLNDPSNTFWQLFFRPDGRSDWTLVTPPGVADNGGLAASPGPDDSIAVVFDPNNLLTFSPFAITTDNGRNWSVGVIPFGTAPVPDVFTAPQSAGTELAALERSGSTIAAGTGNETSWSTRYTRTQLADSAAGRSCGVGDLTALIASESDELVGSSCTSRGVVGIFQGGGTAPGTSPLELVGPKLAASEGEFSVLRMSAQGSRIVALVDARSGSLDTLYALWGEAHTSAWSVSQPFALPARAAIVSSGFGPGGALVVETKSAAGALQAELTGMNGDASWRGAAWVAGLHRKRVCRFRREPRRAQRELVATHRLGTRCRCVAEDPGAHGPDPVRVVGLSRPSGLLRRAAAPA